MAPPPRVDEKYRQQIQEAWKKLEKHVTSDKSSARDLLRLAYASQFSIANHYHDDAKSTTSTDGAKQSTTSTDDTKPTAKKNYLKIIEDIHNEHSEITYPDLYQLAGVVAVKELEGPDIEFIPGREDSTILPDESCLPDLKLRPKELKKFFDKVKISEPKHIVALYGGLKLATSEDQTADLKLDKKYFSDLVLIPSDLVKEFSNSVNKDDLFKEYVDAHKKLSDLGLPHLPFIEEIKKGLVSQVQNGIDTTRAVGLAIAAAVVIFSVFYLINKRRTQHPSQQFQ